MNKAKGVSLNEYINVKCCLGIAERLRDFNVLVGWGMSLNEAKQGKKLRRCYHHPGQVALGATVTLNCDRIYPTRYVMITQAPKMLTLCEVEVYADPKANGKYDI